MVVDPFSTPPPQSNRKTIEQLARLLELHQIDVEAVGRIKSVRVGTHTGYVKNSDGEIVYTEDLPNSSIVFSPAWEDGPQWPVVQPAKPRKPSRTPAKPERPEGVTVAAILPDPQIGFHVDLDGEFHPFHDESAIDLALAITRYAHPDRVVLLGDFLDFPSHSKYRKQPGWQQGTQRSLDYAHDVLARLVEMVPEVDLMEGNHDARLRFWILDNASASFGIKPANAPKSWPVMSVPHLLRLDELGVRYHGGYPASRIWLADHLAIDHGVHIHDSRTLSEEQVSVIHGHTHRFTEQWRTRRTRHGSAEILAASPGCLCRVDGAVPGTRSATDDNARPVKAHQNWQQGMAIVTYTESELLAYEPIRIRDGRAVFRGKVFQA